ncbi:Glucanosyltransferase-domain-containing protein [Xylaria bambusicola]|uniref:Glucanosyltransferase-domain-containing protein n=1 Tax=Xylaria bambusicola TaxID=326684 RepID=UPI002008E803|nr:Glucanosyltransferase-domain-containing protein [Xylaria bambusicola]KAI0503412.1 Glucanosyltransferase-domain-containing protein [Xylaria bambusicola]
MKLLSVLGAAALSGVAYAASYDTIPAIEAFGQHFFYTNNGSQFYMKGVAYQENFSPNGSTSSNVEYTDPLADKAKCARDIPFMKKIFTNVIRVYAIDPTKNHDDCFELLAANDIYVVADLSEPKTSINSNDPEWTVPLYERYASVVDALAKYNNVIGFFAGNEVVQAANQTEASAFVKAAVRDTKAYIKSQGHRKSLGVGYATADVPTRDQLAHYFACQPEDGTDTSIDFWGYNVYSWCGFSNYVASSYGERVEFFSDYPVPVFFAEYGCNENIPGGPNRRPFTEVAVLYGNMTEVFSGGIVYQWFQSENNFGLVQIDGDDVKPEPDFTSLMSQLAKVTPSSTASSAYTPTNTAPACPTNDSKWAPKSSPLPAIVNPELCDCAMSAVTCTIDSDDAESYGAEFGFICGLEDGKYCAGIVHNATLGDYGAYSGCSPKQQLAWVANQYYEAQDSTNQASACDFDGLAKTQAASTGGSCATLLEAAGTDGSGDVAQPTGKVTGGGGSGSDTSDSAAAPNGLSTPAFFNFGKTLFIAYALTALVSGIGMLVL